MRWSSSSLSNGASVQRTSNAEIVVAGRHAASNRSDGWSRHRATAALIACRLPSVASSISSQTPSLQSNIPSPGSRAIGFR